MSILRILNYPDIKLRRQGYNVGNVHAFKIKKVIGDMVETLLHQKNCAALAATQLDIDVPPNIIVINKIESDIKNEVLCLINPIISSVEGLNISEEGCMSIYPQNIYAKVPRAIKIVVTALDINGNKMEFIANNYIARCIQHECDHLNGILYLDLLNKKEYNFIKKKINILIKDKKSNKNY